MAANGSGRITMESPEEPPKDWTFQNPLPPYICYQATTGSIEQHTKPEITAFGTGPCSPRGQRHPPLASADAEISKYLQTSARAEHDADESLQRQRQFEKADKGSERDDNIKDEG